MNLIQDLLQERATAEGERAKQLEEFNLLEILSEGEWCSVITSMLPVAVYDRRDHRFDLAAAISKNIPLRPNHDMVENLLKTMALMAFQCQDEFQPYYSIFDSLESIYQDLAYKESQQSYEDNLFLFNDIVQLIKMVKDELQSKEELKMIDCLWL